MSLSAQAPKIRQQTRVWKTREGKTLRICDMSDEHLSNAIKSLERMQSSIALTSPPCFQGEMAEYYGMMDWENLVNSSIEDNFPIYSILKLEQERRSKIPKTVGETAW